jgi:hypothetical protein
MSTIGDTSDNDDRSGMMGWWIGDALDSPEFLKTRMLFGIVVGVLASILFTYILLQMERQTTSYNAAIMEAAIGERDTQLELEEDTQSTNTSRSDYVQAMDDTGDDNMTVHSTTSTSRNQNITSISTSPKSVLASMTSKADVLFKPGDSRRRILSTSQHVQVTVHATIVILFIYLLLVFLPGSIWLSFVAVFIVWILALQSYLRDEIQRRKRFDRITTMIGLFSIIAGSLALVTYCHLALKEGNIYEGPARIVGYDASTYNNKDGDTMRADLIVAWGGKWGCPDIESKQCTATVQGALCETQYDTNPSPTDGNNRRRRRMESKVVEEVEEYQNEQERNAENNQVATEAPIVQELEEEVDEESEEVNELGAELNTETEIHEEGEGVLEGEVSVLEANSTDTKKEEQLTDMAVGEAFEAGMGEGEVDQLMDQNQKLQDELDTAEETIKELDQEIDELVDEDITYVYDDTIYEDEYWQQQDWDSIWGEYACEDLFDSDLASTPESYDINVAPGNDHWPTVNIYGSCNTCTAYILDYYSTEHFQTIREFENQAYLYYVAGFFFMVTAAILAVIERKRPNTERKISFLSQDCGVAA